MNKYERPQNKGSYSKDVPDTAAVLRKMQYQLDAIERKLDSLVKQSGARDFKRPYPSRPRKEYGDKRLSSKEDQGQRKEASASKGKFYHGLQSGPKRKTTKENFRKK